MARFEERDATQTQIIEHDNDKQAKRVITFSPLVSEDYDEIDLTYIAVGNGTGEIGMVTYLKNGTSVAVLQLSYDSSNRLINVERI